MSRWNAGRRNLGAAGGNGRPVIVEGDEGNVHHAGAGMRTAPSLGRHTPRPPITAGAAAPAKIEVEVPPVAVWPEACPPQHSEAFLSLHRDGPLWMWTCHEAKDRDDYPTLFWRYERRMERLTMRGTGARVQMCSTVCARHGIFASNPKRTDVTMDCCS